ncbi:Peroxin-3 [Scheffersomyces coipomensis]|uniref:Peroxin-3 n=1 Tax=Scheffersomyces coipomensis TaxID=1788519 RepID=UPI00315C7F1B
MAIFSSLASFFNRHKRKIIITTTLTISAYYLVNQFIIKKFRDYQNALRQELIFKQQIKQRFIQTQQDCYYTILALLPVLTSPIIEHLPVELITQALRLKKNNPLPQQQQQVQSSSGPNNPNSTINSELTADNLNLLDNNNSNNQSKLNVYLNKSKVELWNILKIQTITRTLTLIYSISGLLLVTRLQLNILARRSYLESAILMAGVKQPTNPNINSHDNYIVEQSYLSLSWWLLNKGWLNLNSYIEPIVIETFSNINPKTELTIDQFNLLLQQLIKQINFNFKDNILKNLFPNNYDDLIETILNTNPSLTNQLDLPDSNFTKLISETSHIMINDTYFFNLYNNLVLNGLSTLIANLSLNLNHGNGSTSLLISSGNLKDDTNTINTLNQTKSFKLASYLAQLSIQNGVLIDNDNLRDINEFGYNDDYDLDGDNLTKHLNEEDIEGFINNLANNEGIFNKSGNGDGNNNGNNLSGNMYLNTLNEVEELDDFSAGIYSNFE